MNSKDLVVISIYDCFCDFAVLVDDKIYTDHWSGLGREIYDAYYDDRNYEGFSYDDNTNGHLTDYWHKWLKERFPKKTIIICEDGAIEKLE